MRIRSPSLGLIYLTVAVSVFIAFLVYIRMPMWWDLENGQERDLAEARYLIDIAATGKPGQQTAWLSDAMKLASKHAEWQLAGTILTQSIENKVKLDATIVAEVVPGKCWIASSTRQAQTVGKLPSAFFCRNEGAQPWTLQTQWSASRDGAVETRERGQAWQSHAIKTANNTLVEWVVPTGNLTYWEVRTNAAMYTDKDKPNGSFQGVELMGFKAKS
jgi:hypothetical protein